MKKPVVLAPAGTIDSLKAAAAYRADAVYLGVEAFNARMKAGNFTIDTLAEWVKYAHTFGVKVYVTLNTMIKENEFSKACEIADKIYLSGADGIIVTDLGLLRYCAEKLNGLEVFASTQLSIANEYGARFAKETGVYGVVMAREGTNEDIRRISAIMPTEVFIHGAMCVCVSGQCYMSSMADGNSGNRGLCAQPCRKQYTASHDGNKLRKGYLLSMRDMCSVDTMKDYIESGAGVFKIEGRNRRSEYVAQAVKTYENLVSSGYTVSKKNLSDLKKMFNRGDYTKGYGYDGNGNGVMSVNIQGHMGVIVGKIVGVKSAGNQIGVKMTQPYVKGDAFKIISTAGLEVGSAVALNDSKNQKNGILFYKGKPSVGDYVAITTDKTLIDSIETEPHLDVEMKFYAQVGEKARLEVTSGENSAVVFSENIVEAAANLPTEKDVVVSQLSRTGETFFRCSCLDVELLGNVFLPKSVLNNMRRYALDKLTEEINKPFFERKAAREEYLLLVKNKEIDAQNAVNPDVCQDTVDGDNYNAYNDGYNSGKKASEETEEKPVRKMFCFSDLSQLEDFEFSENDIPVYKPYDFDVKDIHSKAFERFGEKLYVDLPNIALYRDIEVIIKWLSTYSVKGIVANNVYALQLGKELGINVIGGIGLNIANLATKDFLAERFNVKEFIFSIELSESEIVQTDRDNGFVFVRGAVTNMTLTHCPYKIAYKYNDCKSCKCNEVKNGYLYLTDEIGNKFKIKRRRVASCYFNLLNCLPVNYGDERLLIHDYYVDLTDRASENGQFTKGRLFKGVK